MPPSRREPSAADLTFQRAVSALDHAPDPDPASRELEDDHVG